MVLCYIYFQYCIIFPFLSFIMFLIIIWRDKI
nr:MAG TPA: hypothetical protein [Caudoviricetes sp.]